MYTLGLDIGSSSVKVSLLNVESGQGEGTVFLPKDEMPITSRERGWAEQSPDMWWRYSKESIISLLEESKVDVDKIIAIGISYQMHGLVVVDSEGAALRDAIIWCDSRAVEIGERAYRDIGEELCMDTTLNSPGNFTASKLAWIKENEPDIYSKIDKIMLPGDYVAYKLTGDIVTTPSGLSEGILWNFKDETPSREVLKSYGIAEELLADIKDTFSDQGTISPSVAEELGLSPNVKVSYRAGDQPNNAFSLNVMEPGEIASTAGTSGVVYGVTDKLKGDYKARVNSFAHVNHSSDSPRVGVLLCINGTGITNSWIRHNFASHLSYEEMNVEAAKAAAGSNGLLIYPYGNGAERMLGNRFPGATIREIDFNQHTLSHIIRASHEGIAFAFKQGVEAMAECGVDVKRIKAGKANMFLSPIFRQTLANVTGATIDLFDTDGSLGAARGAAYGIGLYKSREEMFSSSEPIMTITPDRDREVIEEHYTLWTEKFN